MQNDGNFVVYKKPGPQGIPGNNAVWATNTVRGSGSYQLRMQTDGNVVLYRNGSEVLWASNTASTASPTTVSFINWYPTNVSIGRSGGFGYEMVGSSPSALGQTQSVTYTFTISAGKTIRLTVGFGSVALEPTHYTGLPFAWSANSYSIVSSTGVWYQGEVFNATRTLSSGNPFRNHNPDVDVLDSAGPQLEITGVTGNVNNRLTLNADGGLTVYTNTNTVLYASGYSNSNEPLVTTGTVDPLRDVCGKRISSCKKRFGDYADLPFGSFPSAGTFYG
jgi:hypothetical protein